MKTRHFVFLLAPLAPLCFPALHAQNTAPAPNPTPAPPTVTVSGPTDRISNTMSKTLSAGIKYEAPKPTEKPQKKPEPTEASADDQPKNGIVRLPKYIVEGTRPPIFRERDVYSSKGLAQLAVNRYFNETGKALNRATLPLFGNGMQQAAMQMYEDDERLKNMQEADHNIYILKQTDPVAAEQMQREVNQMYMRRPEFSPVNSTSRAK